MVDDTEPKSERTHVKNLIAIFIPLALLLLVACGGGDNTDNSSNNGSDGDSGATRTKTPVPAEENGDGNGEETPPGSLDPLAAVCRENPDPANDDEVQVEEPLGGDPVTSPVTVRGQVAAFEATFKITIFDAAGATIADVTGMSSEGQTLAPFAQEMSFSVTQETDACMWVYEASARDGSPINVLQIPLRLQP
jgi:hypothetical protein